MQQLTLLPKTVIAAGLEETALYHEADSLSYVAVCFRHPETLKFKQESVKIADLFEHISTEVPDGTDVWISQGEFGKPNRRTVNLTRMGLCFVDLDVYKSPAANVPRPQIIDQIHEICRSAGIPSPSWINDSGQGFQAKWLLSSYINRQALVRWKLVQDRLVEIFKPLGSDSKAKDASRILRFVGTINTANGRNCSTAFIRGTCLDTASQVSFETLTGALLSQKRMSAEERRSNTKSDLKLVATNAKAGILRGYNTRQLAWDRLADLRLLAEIRGGIKEGMRNSYLLVVACQLALSGLIHPRNFKSEVRELQKEISSDPVWLRDTGLLGSLEARVRAHYKNEMIDFGERKITPIYTYKTENLIKILEITQDEQRQLRTLISKDLATERNTLRERKKRRSQGVLERAEYLESKKQTKDERTAQIHVMAATMTNKQIAEKIGVSVETVRKALAK